MKFELPEESPRASYHLLAWADPARPIAERDETNNVAAERRAGRDRAGDARFFRDGVGRHDPARAGAPRGMATLLLRYDGNVPAGGALGIELRASSDTTLDGADTVACNFFPPRCG